MRRYLTLGIDPRPVDDAIAYIGLAQLEDGPRAETVTITGHDVHYSRNEAAARARLLMCVPRDSYGDSALGSGSRSNFASACRSLRPLEDGTQLTLNAQWPPVEYLVLEVEPTRPGSVVVDGLELTYQRSVDHVLQQGTQRIEMTLDLTAT